MRNHSDLGYTESMLTLLFPPAAPVAPRISKVKVVREVFEIVDKSNETPFGDITIERVQPPLRIVDSVMYVVYAS